MYNKISDICILGREEVYKASPRIWSFKYADDIVNGIQLNLSNMVGCYPFMFGGFQWRDSERLYLCGEFSTNTEQDYQIQRKLVEAKSGYAAKRFVKTPNKRFVRADFAEFRLQWMLYVVWHKCQGHADFCKLLMQVPCDVVLIENTTTNKVDSIGEWRGQNNIGKILMICRDCIKEGKQLVMDYSLLRDAQIHIFGKLLQFG